ncbi:hypothetical protein [Limobrevibacterium gyesilva]|uniref:Uncharacterized protein n=1 Tax=Limobrevibacterium gyesilva TaxID=2991712 RepID=A0AA41YVZ1_9PROT|nr:hypothetical protein [Limobrevibacterium gyesilva]MCW3477400.1 hypothetical protein [Limobrevibacterium gyesilva]
MLITSRTVPPRPVFVADPARGGVTVGFARMTCLFSLADHDYAAGVELDSGAWRRVDLAWVHELTQVGDVLRRQAVPA